MPPKQGSGSSTHSNASTAGHSGSGPSRSSTGLTAISNDALTERAGSTGKKVSFTPSNQYHEPSPISDAEGCHRSDEERRVEEAKGKCLTIKDSSSPSGFGSVWIPEAEYTAWRQGKQSFDIETGVLADLAIPGSALCTCTKFRSHCLKSHPPIRPSDISEQLEKYPAERHSQEGYPIPKDQYLRQCPNIQTNGTLCQTCYQCTPA